MPPRDSVGVQLILLGTLMPAPHWTTSSVLFPELVVDGPSAPRDISDSLPCPPGPRVSLWGSLRSAARPRISGSVSETPV